MSTPTPTTPPTCSSSSSLSTEHSLLSEQELDELELVPDVRLTYDIEAYSSFMSTYAPRHILDDRPSDPGSRWSSATTNSPQFLLLVLPSLAIIRILCSAWHSSANPLTLSRTHSRIRTHASVRSMVHHRYLLHLSTIRIPVSTRGD